MKKLFLFILLTTVVHSSAQNFSGAVFLRDYSNLYLNQVYVTNLNTQKTVLTDYTGAFILPAKAGESIRFTSIITERKDILVTPEMLEGRRNLFELRISYYDIEEVVIARFKPSGNLRADVAKMKTGEKKMKLREMIGLPEASGDGRSPQAPVASFADGGLAFSINSIFDIISGDRKRQERLAEYEKMSAATFKMKNYFGDDYFTKIKIPKNLIQNFLQFIYTSENLEPFLAAGNFEATKIYIEKYLPIYLKRLENSELRSILK